MPPINIINRHKIFTCILLHREFKNTYVCVRQNNNNINISIPKFYRYILLHAAAQLPCKCYNCLQAPVAYLSLMFLHAC